MLKPMLFTEAVVRSVLDSNTKFIPKIEELTLGKSAWLLSPTIDLFGKITSASIVAAAPEASVAVIF